MPRLSSQIVIRLLGMVLTVAPAAADAQNFVELGSMSGSGLIWMPTSSVSPTAQFRVGLGRIGLASETGEGVNVYSFVAGLSPFFEAYLRYTSEQAGEFQSVGAVGFGGKFTIPAAIPLLSVASVWGEASTSKASGLTRLSQPNVSRGGVIVTPVSNGFRLSLLAGGVAAVGGRPTAFEGASVVVPASHGLEIGAEFLNGYNGVDVRDAMISASIRILPNLSLTGGPGYRSSPQMTGWLWSVGLSAGTSDVDFRPAIESAQKREYRLPSIEELEKSSNEEKKQ